MTTIRAGAIIASSILLFGCAEETQRNKMEAALSPWVGRSIADYVLSRGPPTNTVNLGPDKRGFQWVLTGVAVPSRCPGRCLSDWRSLDYGSASAANVHGKFRG